MDEEYIYQIDAEGLTPAQVAEMFARDYFAERRTVDKITNDGDSTLFTLVDGTWAYRIRCHPPVLGIRPAVYRVTTERWL